MSYNSSDTSRSAEYAAAARQNTSGSFSPIPFGSQNVDTVEKIVELVRFGASTIEKLDFGYPPGLRRIIWSLQTETREPELRIDALITLSTMPNDPPSAKPALEVRQTHFIRDEGLSTLNRLVHSPKKNEMPHIDDKVIAAFRTALRDYDGVEREALEGLRLLVEKFEYRRLVQAHGDEIVSSVVDALKAKNDTYHFCPVGIDILDYMSRSPSLDGFLTNEAMRLLRQESRLVHSIGRSLPVLAS
jgi:hypothetical protein